MYAITVVHAWFLYSSKPIKCTPRVNPNVNDGLWVIMMGPCKCLSCNKDTPGVKDVDRGEVVHVRGQGVYGDALYFPVSFAVNLKLLEKQSALKRNFRICYQLGGSHHVILSAE